MTAESFYEYIANIFYPWCIETKIVFPIILYVDGHSSHLTMALSNFCIEHQIELIALYPNATHLFQPMDVAIFCPLKSAWKKAVTMFRMENDGRCLQKKNFGSVLKTAIDLINISNILQNGFKTCGLWPFSANALDYSKLLQTESNKKTCSEPSKETNHQQSHLIFIEKNINKDILALFTKAEADGQWKGSIEHKSLFKFWLKIKQFESFQLQETNSINNQFIHLDAVSFNSVNNERNQSVEINEKSTSNQFDIQELESAPIWILNDNGSLQKAERESYSISTETQENNANIELLENTTKIAQQNNEENINSSNIDLSEKNNIKTEQQNNKNDTINNNSVIKISEENFTLNITDNISEISLSEISPFKNINFWPHKEDNKRKSKEKIPAVATSSQWRMYHQMKIELKEKIEKEKQIKQMCRKMKKEEKEEQRRQTQEERKAKMILKAEIKKKRIQAKENKKPKENKKRNIKRNQTKIPKINIT